MGGGGACAPPQKNNAYIFFYMLISSMCKYFAPPQYHAYAFMKYALKYAYFTVFNALICKWLFLPTPNSHPYRSNDLFSFLFCELVPPENEDLGGSARNFSAPYWKNPSYATDTHTHSCIHRQSGRYVTYNATEEI